MHPEPPSIRAARVADAAAGAACHVACWREGYAGIVDPAVLAECASDLEERAGRWRRQLEMGARRWLAVAPNARVVGFAASGPGRDEDIDVACELEAIYIRHAYWVTGLAAHLLHAAIGADAAYLWVFAANDRARGFYTPGSAWSVECWEKSHEHRLNAVRLTRFGRARRVRQSQPEWVSAVRMCSTPPR